MWLELRLGTLNLRKSPEAIHYSFYLFLQPWPLSFLDPSSPPSPLTSQYHYFFFPHLILFQHVNHFSNLRIFCSIPAFLDSFFFLPRVGCQATVRFLKNFMIYGNQLKEGCMRIYVSIQYTNKGLSWGLLNWTR